jgi:hypothetical protein
MQSTKFKQLTLEERKQLLAFISSLWHKGHHAKAPMENPCPMPLFPSLFRRSNKRTKE